MNLWDRALAAVVRRRGLSLALALGLLAAGAVLARGIPFSTGVTEYLPADAPEVKAWLELSHRFDAFDALMVGLEEPSAPLTAEGLAALKRVTDSLAEQKAAGILGARSISNIDSMREGEDGTLNNELLVAEIPKDAAGLEALSRRLAADLQVSGALISRDQRGYVVLIRADPRKDSADVARVVEQTVERERGPLRAFYFGAPFFTAAISKKIYAQLTWIVPVFALLLLGVLAFGLRRPAVIALVLGCAGVSLLGWLGLVRLFGLGLSQTSLNAGLPLLVLAVVAYARGLEGRFGSSAPDAVAFPAPVAATLAALAAANLLVSKVTIAYLASFGVAMAVGLLAVLLVGVLLFAPAASFLKAPAKPVSEPRAHLPTGHGFALGAGVLLVAGLLAAGARFYTMPQRMFSRSDEVGQALRFFDERFAGTDVLQIDFRGDLRDPSTAARLMRFTDLLEGQPAAFPDVRSVTQILGFLNKGFAGMHRVPPSRESLANLWFFLEGSPDVKNLVSDDRDEAMVVIRVPSEPTQPIAELVAAAEAARADSEKLGAEGARLRLAALARRFGVPVPAERLEAVVAAATAPLAEEELRAVDERVFARVRAFLASPDSPYQPSDEEWGQLSLALAGSAAERSARVTEAVAAMPEPAEGGFAEEFAGTVLSHEKDLRLAVRSGRLAERLWEGTQAKVPAAFQVRAQGVLADLLDPHADAAAAVPVAVTGMPVVAATVEATLLRGLWMAIATLLGGAALALLALRLRPRSVVRGLFEAALATAITLAICRLTGLQIDAGSATLYLMPPMLGFLTAGWVGRANGFSRRKPVVFLLALAAAGLTLLFTGVLPVVRIGAGMSLGLCAVALVSYVSGLFRTQAEPR